MKLNIIHSIQDLLPVAATTTAAAAIIIVVLYILKFWRSSSTCVKKRKPNYPPIAGTIFHQLLNFNRPIDYLTEISRKYKTFRMLTPSCNYVYTVDPANVEYIAKTNFANYGKGKMIHDLLEDFLGDGILAVDGKKWQHQMKLASIEFSTKVLREYSSAAFKTNAIKLARIVATAAESFEMIEIQDLLMRTTLDSIFKVAFAVELDTLSGSSEEGVAFAEALEFGSASVIRRLVDVFWKIKRFLNIGEEATMRRSMKLIDDFLYQVMDSRVKEMCAQDSHSIQKGDMLSRFLLEREKDPEHLSYKYLRDIILNFVGAGRDTTAGTLAWFFYMLCKHPDIQEKVAKEVMLATMTDDKNITIDNFADSLTEEALRQMQYLQAALSETLRLYPAIPMDVSCCFSDDTLPNGLDIKKGDIVGYLAYSMGRMEFLWSGDAEEFKPERWLNNGQFVPESPFKFSAFHAGPRVCLGKEFAYRQMKIIAATLVRFFKFKLWDEQKPVKYRVMLTLQIDGGICLSALQR